jgi:P-type E1-E2 ATPase
MSEAAKALGKPLPVASEVSEKPGQGLRGKVLGHEVQVTSRSKLINLGRTPDTDRLTPGAGLECVVLIDGKLAAQYRFRDAPRTESRPFVRHLSRQHHINRVMIVSGDREEEVRYLAKLVDITEVHAGKSPEEKVAIVQAETLKAPTIYVGDGINDAPALMIATVGIAFGRANNVTSEAAGAVIMESSIAKLDEFFHIGQRMRSIALQSAIGGICLSVLGMGAAAFGFLTPVAGAVAQEIIDLCAVLNALRAAVPPKQLTDY